MLCHMKKGVMMFFQVVNLYKHILDNCFVQDGVWPLLFLACQRLRGGVQKEKGEEGGREVKGEEGDQ